MQARQPRHLLVPNANSPELLARLLEMVSRGLRSTRALAEALNIDARTVGYYTVAGAWLGLLEYDEEAELTAVGLEFVYAGEGRAAVYGRAVRANSLVQGLLQASDGALPSVGAVSTAIHAIAPDMARSTVRRRASAIRALIAPAIGAPDVSRAPERQMQLPLAAPRPPPIRSSVVELGDASYNPDAYRYLLCALLDHGELGLRHVRGLLDRAGAADAPIGDYIELLIHRGDAFRDGNTLVASPCAAQRAELTESTASIILSDPRYRSYLEQGRRGRVDRVAASLAREQSRRFRSWDHRLFDRTVDFETLDTDLESILLDRSLDNFPLATPGPIPAPTPSAPFLQVWREAGLLLACPPSLASLQGGLAATNLLLRRQRQAGQATHTPAFTDPRTRVHGGLLHPGESVPRAIPDTRSLRIRMVNTAPFITLCTALLLTHRQQPHRLVVHHHKAAWRVRWDDLERGTLFALFDAFAAAQDWTVLRRPTSGLTAQALLDTLEAVGITSSIGQRVVLSERFFTQLRNEPEESELHAQLSPLAQRLEDHLGAACR